MAFPEKVKLEAKQQANFSCVICKEPFVEVHHIIPQSEGGSDTIENAAPLCGSCHDLFGGNPDKRKQIREMRDFWWEVCGKKNTIPDLAALTEKLDAIQSEVRSSQASHSQALEDIKKAYLAYHSASESSIVASGTISDLSGVTGATLPFGYRLLVTPGYNIASKGYANVGIDVSNLSERRIELHNIVGEFWTNARFISWASARPNRRYAAKKGGVIFVYYDFSIPMLHHNTTVRIAEWRFRPPSEREFIPIGVRVVSSETPWQASNWRVVREDEKVRITSAEQRAPK